jgi:hypothetical protein
MATTRKKTVSVVLDNPQPKKLVTRFDAADTEPPDAALTSIYVNKQALANLGDPAKIKVTIEAA